MAASRSLVLVLPALPVTANTIALTCASPPGPRPQSASGCRPLRRPAASALTASSRLPPLATSAAPASNAASTKSWPSNRSPRKSHEEVARGGPCDYRCSLPTGSSEGARPSARPASSAGVSSIIACASPPRQRLPGHPPVVERQGLARELLPGLVALTEDHHHVARAAPRTRSADGEAPIWLHDARLPVLEPAMISAMMPSGSSLRGLSEVTTTTSAVSLSLAAHEGPLPSVASPPQPMTAINSPAREAPSRTQDVVHRIGSVGVVDQTVKAALRLRSPCGRAPPEALAGPEPSAAGRVRDPSPIRERPRVFATLKTPSKGVLHLDGALAAPVAPAAPARASACPRSTTVPRVPPPQWNSRSTPSSA